MINEEKFYMVRSQALPDALLKTAKVNALLHSGRVKTIREAINIVGISRSAYYKYKDDIIPVREKLQGKTITFVMEMEDSPGRLASILRIVAECNANILSIHQSVPVNNIALVTLSVLVLPTTEDITRLLDKMEEAGGIHNLKIVSAD